MSEQQHTAGPEFWWGDRCDPVPNPNVTIQEEVEIFEAPALKTCTATARNTFLVRPLKSYSRSDPDLSVPVPSVPTSVRLCRPNADFAIACDQSPDVRDDLLVESTCAPIPGNPAACDPSDPLVVPERPAHRYHRMAVAKYDGSADPTPEGGDPRLRLDSLGPGLAPD